MLERTIEMAFTAAVKKRGGLALKFVSPGMSGVPDRLVLIPSSKMAFVEIKAPGKTMRAIQIKRKGQLEALGFLVYTVDSIEAIAGVLDAICAS